MILVTLGTQDKKFYRLLDEINELIIKNKITDEVIVQAGVSSDYKTNLMKIYSLLSMDEFDDLISRCDLLITHGGVGSILAGLKKGKKVIAVPRLLKYKEHVNDHQIQIVNNFSDEGYILKVDNIKKLYKTIELSKNFKPRKYVSNNKAFVEIIDKAINNYI